MIERAEILIIDYDNKIPKAFSDLSTKGYRVRIAKDNRQARMHIKNSVVVVALVSERRKEIIKLMEHTKNFCNPNLNFILILGGGDDRVFLERVDKLTFQCFKKYRFGMDELSKTISNAIEMKDLKNKETRFLNDLNRIEEDLMDVEDRLFNLTTLKNSVMRGRPIIN